MNPCLELAQKLNNRSAFSTSLSTRFSITNEEREFIKNNDLLLLFIEVNRGYYLKLESTFCETYYVELNPHEKTNTFYIDVQQEEPNHLFILDTDDKNLFKNYMSMVKLLNRQLLKINVVENGGLFNGIDYFIRWSIEEVGSNIPNQFFNITLDNNLFYTGLILNKQDIYNYLLIPEDLDTSCVNYV